MRTEGSNRTPVLILTGSPGGARGKEPACQRRRQKRHRVGKIPWRRKWQPTPVLLPGESHGQSNPAGCSPWVTQSRTRLSDSALTHAHWASQVALVTKNPPVSAGDSGLIPGSERYPGGGKATCSSILAWRIPWTEELGGLQSMGSQRVRHDSNGAHARFILVSIPVFFPFFVFRGFNLGDL